MSACTRVLDCIIQVAHYPPLVFSREANWGWRCDNFMAFMREQDPRNAAEDEREFREAMQMFAAQ
jgi:hypothetical protein